MTADTDSRRRAVLTWACTPVALAFISSFALYCGVSHPWLQLATMLCLLLACAAAFYTAGVCAALVEQAAHDRRELETLNQSYTDLKTLNSKMKQQLDHEAETREIQVSSHADSFSESLRTILSVTHLATDARSLSIFLESRRGSGLFSKALMRWDPRPELAGAAYVYFDEETILNADAPVITGFRLKPQEVADEEGRPVLGGILLQDERTVGTVQYEPAARAAAARPDPQALEAWVSALHLPGAGVIECWRTRKAVTREAEGYCIAYVPIISQQLTIGVLGAEFPIPADRRGYPDEVLKRLKERGLSMGYPLKKEELYEQATKDGLTGLFNKTHYGTQFQDCFHQMQRYGRDLSFIFADIDHFKSVNDTHGHQAGDQVLKGVSRLIAESIRKSDMAFRIGGEELAVLLVETPLDKAVGVAEKLRAIIEQTPFDVAPGTTIHVTTSFGVAQMTKDTKTPDDLAAAADAALYRAKHGGRNRVVTATAADLAAPPAQPAPVPGEP